MMGDTNKGKQDLMIHCVYGRRCKVQACRLLVSVQEPAGRPEVRAWRQLPGCPPSLHHLLNLDNNPLSLGFLSCRIKVLSAPSSQDSCQVK